MGCDRNGMQKKNSLTLDSREFERQIRKKVVGAPTSTKAVRDACKIVDISTNFSIKDRWQTKFHRKSSIDGFEHIIYYKHFVMLIRMSHLWKIHLVAKMRKNLKSHKIIWSR